MLKHTTHTHTYLKTMGGGDKAGRHCQGVHPWKTSARVRPVILNFCQGTPQSTNAQVAESSSLVALKCERREFRILGGNPGRERATEGASPQVCLESSQIFGQLTKPHVWGRHQGFGRKTSSSKMNKLRRYFSCCWKRYICMRGRVWI